MGGAVGAMHAWGEQGPALNEAISRRLGLGHFDIPARSAVDHITEYVLQLALFGTSIGRIVNELYQLMGDEFGEVVEDLGAEVIGSSTMPHKVNPKLSVRILAQAAQLRSHSGIAFEAMQASGEGDNATNLLVYACMQEPSILAYELLCDLDELLPAIRFLPHNMLRNVEMSGGLIAAENVMMTLAPSIGRTRAHDLVHHCAAQACARGISFIDALLDDETVAQATDRATLISAIDPTPYTGLCVPRARISLASGLAAAARLRAQS